MVSMNYVFVTLCLRVAPSQAVLGPAPRERGVQTPPLAAQRTKSAHFPRQSVIRVLAAECTSRFVVGITQRVSSRVSLSHLGATPPFVCLAQSNGLGTRKHKNA